MGVRSKFAPQLDREVECSEAQRTAMRIGAAQRRSPEWPPSDTTLMLPLSCAGLYLPSAQDGAAEEGSPIIQPGHSLTYAYTPKPASTRWYHSHAMAMTNLTKSTYSGEFGFLIVESAAGDPGSYDREVLLASHAWEGEWVSMQDIKKGPPPDNGLEVMYHAATLGDQMLGH